MKSHTWYRTHMGYMLWRERVVSEYLESELLTCGFMNQNLCEGSCAAPCCPQPHTVTWGHGDTVSMGTCRQSPVGTRLSFPYQHVIPVSNWKMKPCPLIWICNKQAWDNELNSLSPAARLLQGSGSSRATAGRGTAAAPLPDTEG